MMAGQSSFTSYSPPSGIVSGGRWFVLLLLDVNAVRVKMILLEETFQLCLIYKQSAWKMGTEVERDYFLCWYYLERSWEQDSWLHGQLRGMAFMKKFLKTTLVLNFNLLEISVMQWTFCTKTISFYHFGIVQTNNISLAAANRWLASPRGAALFSVRVVMAAHLTPKARTRLASQILVPPCEDCSFSLYPSLC